MPRTRGVKEPICRAKAHERQPRARLARAYGTQTTRQRPLRLLLARHGPPRQVGHAAKTKEPDQQARPESDHAKPQEVHETVTVSAKASPTSG